MRWMLAGGALLLLGVAGCALRSAKGPPAAVLTVTSTAFADGAMIPDQYTARGENVNPPLAWTGGSGDEACYAVICEDPDAPGGVWTHWLVWNIEATSLEENLPLPAAFSVGMSLGTNSWHQVGWGGPDPPSGTHHYHFRVFGLSQRLELSTATEAAGLRSAMRPLIVSEGELVGLAAATPEGAVATPGAAAANAGEAVATPEAAAATPEEAAAKPEEAVAN